MFFSFQEHQHPLHTVHWQVTLRVHVETRLNEMCLLLTWKKYSFGTRYGIIWQFLKHTNTYKGNLKSKRLADRVNITGQPNMVADIYYHSSPFWQLRKIVMDSKIPWRQHRYLLLGGYVFTCHSLLVLDEFGWGFQKRPQHHHLDRGIFFQGFLHYRTTSNIFSLGGNLRSLQISLDNAEDN